MQDRYAADRLGKEDCAAFRVSDHLLDVLPVVNVLRQHSWGKHLYSPGRGIFRQCKRDGGREGGLDWQIYHGLGWGVGSIRVRCRYGPAVVQTWERCHAGSALGRSSDGGGRAVRPAVPYFFPR